MEPELRILHLEDDPLDSELVRKFLAADGLAAQLDRVDTLAAFEEALQTGVYALILSDYSLPGMDAMEALGLARRVRSDIPFIFLSGVLGEERAIETLKLGASDYVLKSHMGRLAPAVRRALQEAEAQAHRKQAEEALKESEERFRRAITYAPFPIMLHAENGEVIQVNRAWTELTGYTAEEIPTIQAWVERAYGERKDAVLADVARLYSLYTRLDEGEHVITTKKGETRTWHFSSSALGRLPDQRRLVISMALDITERKQMEETIKHQAHHDLLTGLPNRKLFLDILSLKLAQSSRNQEKFAVLFLDLDRFKHINDSLGHDVGDQMLKGVAERLRCSVRGSDAVARFGGDEFNILLTDIAQTEDVSKVAQKIIGRFRDPYLIHGYELRTSTSIGISVYPDDGEDIDALLKNADIAMYHAKETGGSTYRFFNPAMNVRAFERMRLESALRQSIERGELAVYYQPQLLIGSSQVMGAEALVRWQHPERGLLSAADFIPLAEEVGFITEVDEWVLRAACAQIKAWQEAGMLLPLYIAVNLSAQGFHRADLAGGIARVLEETGLDPGCLEVEITESTTMQDIELTVEHLSRLAELGVGISIDDFGTGYSSLSYLKRLPIQKLKIDKSFVRDIANDPDDRTIISAVVAMAHNMKIKVVAEGVETEAQLSFLREVGCQEMQGYLISRPLPAEEFEALVRRADSQNISPAH